jgi:hypothetical protein
VEGGIDFAREQLTARLGARSPPALRGDHQRGYGVDQQRLEPQFKRVPARREGSGLAGFFGIATPTLELPLTATLMRHAIADIARHYGGACRRSKRGLPASKFARSARQTRGCGHIVLCEELAPPSVIIKAVIPIYICGG